MVEWTADPAATVSRIGVTASGGGGRASGGDVPPAAGGGTPLADLEAPETAAVPRSQSWLRRRSRSVRGRVRSAMLRMALFARTRAEAGMSTAEYAVGTIAACGFAALLWKILTSGEVKSMLSALVQKALKLAG
ncbi:DUF4244 domain-containing protein [Sphaerimonospora sp. CA-214678]|uniref:DUF4244 domain-containing protein n=1 Tax=Sphaerimonospora sp. CA-214678 TaxID=3240029 RepID=UPI003D8DDA8F